ncbi:stage II sporulation protein M [Brevibacillus sp. H7]|jgi:stage II sporulation protein M|uniref:stage II sporulation protein M n=1 Tax=Brevibacillus sp. H7 TaxID=3349138 RepID=UPI00382AD068
MGNQLRQLWSDNKGYFLAAGLLLLGGATIGFFQADMVETLAKQMLAQIKEIVDRIKENGGSVAATFWAIFKNNVISSLMMMALGVFFAVFPIVGLLSNGVLLGFIMAKISAAGVNPLLVFAVGILPHGIFELPAVVFASAVGIRLGMLSFRSIGALLRINRAELVKNEWHAALKQFPAAVLTVVVLLFIAAFVESVVTPLLLQNTVGGQFQLFK